MASGLALGILGMMNLGGPVFPGQGVVAPPGVWETRYCMWLQGREPSGSSTTFQTTPIFRRPLGPVKWVLT